MESIWEWVKHLFGFYSFECGEVVVMSCGIPHPQEIFIETDKTVREVWIKVVPEGIHACGGGQCFVSEATPVSGGFTITVICNANACDIKWAAVVI